jgi:hypothetical protein
MAKKKIDLFAFWHYSPSPPWRGGHVIAFEPDGWVVTEELPHKAVRPVLILPVLEGEALMAKIREIDLERASELARVKQKYDDLFRSLHNGLK